MDVVRNKKKIKVVHVLGALNTGGIQRLVLDIIKNYDSDNFELYVICWRKGHFYEEYKQILGSRLIYLNISENTYLNKLKIGFELFYQLISTLKRLKIDIIHTHSPQMNYYSIIIKLIIQIRIIHTKHNILFYNKIFETFPDFFFDSITSVSKSIKKSFNNKKIRIIYNGIDLYAIDNATKNITIFNSKYYNILSVGRLTYQKGYDHLIKTFDLIHAKNNNTKLYICGEGELKEEIENLIKILNLEHSVFLLGERNDIFNLMKSSDLFMLTSNYEGLGIVFLEAIASRTISIGSNVDGIPEIIHHNKTGFLINRIE